jgi:hypothetical protein
MDQALSPDLEAYWCYAIVLVLALFVAAAQTRQLLRGLANAWATARAWLLLAAYTSVPLLLFWVLDRADALHDTSLFAAILVALTYRQILTGGSQGINVPTGLAQAWQPFVTWSNHVAASISARIARNNSRFDQAVIARLVNEPPAFEQIRKTVLNHSADPVKVQAALDSRDKLKPPLDDAGVLERKASDLFLMLKALPDVDANRFLLDNNLIGKGDYYWYAEEWKSKLVVAATLLASAVAAVVLLVKTEGSLSTYQVRYHLWRLEKVNATPADRFRATQFLESGLDRREPIFLNLVPQKLTSRLRFDGLPLDTADRFLALLRSQPLQDSASLLPGLADALRTANADLRAHVEKDLLYWAALRGLTLPSRLQAWNPSKDDADTCVDAISNAWKAIAAHLQPGSLACLAQ